MVVFFNSLLFNLTIIVTQKSGKYLFQVNIIASNKFMQVIFKFQLINGFLGYFNLYHLAKNTYEYIMSFNWVEHTYVVLCWLVWFSVSRHG